MSIALLVVAVAVAAPAAKDGKERPPSLVGEWEAVKGVRDGAETDIPAGRYTLTFTADGKMTERRAGGPNGEGTYATDPAKAPAEVDFVSTSEKGKPPVRGIYKVDGDTLTLCLVEKDGAERPKSFDASDGSKAVLVILKRVRKKD
jgi:uncharacterized protein (TIGR03067 family)